MNEALAAKFSLLERVTVQAEVLLPVLKALRRELGVERANQLVYSALREWSKDLYRQVGSKKSGGGKAKWRAVSEELDAAIGDDVEIQSLKDDSDALEFNVTGCRYAQFFLEIGEPELGAIMTCEIDDHVAALGYPEVELSRPQTIMGGSKQCNFRYAFRKTNDK